MDRIRHALGVVAFVVRAPGLFYWFLIHLLATRSA
jgi:hypothetical protein